MPVSPQDFALWASATGRKYPSTPGERAQLTPEVFNFVRNLPKTGLQGAAGVGVERVVYEQPIAVRHEDDNSVFTSPITPDNHVPKVAGTIGNTMTSDHYEGQQLENEEDKADGTNFARTAAKLALAAGLVAGGVAAARSPAVRGRVSEFLSQFGTPREGVVDTVAATGDITPPTTAQNYEQEVIAPQTQIQQAARGAAPGTPLKAMDPTTTESFQVKPVTESEVITTTQNFSSRGFNPRVDPWTGQETPLQETQGVPSFFKSQVYASDVVDPWRDPSILRGAESIEAVHAKSKLGQYIAERNLQESPAKVSVIGRFPGPEGSSASGVTFTPVQGEIESKPARYTALSRGGVTEGDSGPSAMLSAGQSKYAEYGLTAPETHVIPEHILGKVQAFLGARGSESLPSHQKQALNIYQTTGDPAALETAFSSTPALPINVRLPGGEQVATKELFTPFGPVVNPETGVPVVQTREEALLRAQGEQGIRSRVRERAMQKIEELTGQRPVYPSQQQVAALPSEQKRALMLGQRDVAAAEAALESAKEMGTLYRLKPEAERGTYTGPEFEVDPGTGLRRFIGMRPQVEQETIATPGYYQMKAAGGAGRQEMGGVGRRREAIQSSPGGTEFVVSPGSELEATPFLYRHVDTGELLQPASVTEQMLKSETVRPVRGTAVEPQRIMGSEGRTFKGVSATEIDPRSFDPVERAALAKQFPERVTPEGLIYSEQAMGGREAAKQRAMGRRAISESGADPGLGTRFARRPAAPQGSPRAERLEILRQRSEAIRRILSGEATMPRVQGPQQSYEYENWGPGTGRLR